MGLAEQLWLHGRGSAGSGGPCAEALYECAQRARICAAADGREQFVPQPGLFHEVLQQAQARRSFHVGLESAGEFKAEGGDQVAKVDRLLG